jgi:predicted metal-dependent phosphoesterase TrpH
VHTTYSGIPGYPFLRDSVITLEDVIELTRKKNIDGVAITDHNTIAGALKLKKYVKRRNLNLSVIVGEEVRTLSGDILALDVDSKIEHGNSVEETLDRIRECNGLAVACHPYAGNGVGEKMVKTQKFDIIETLNSCASRTANIRAKELALSLGLTGIGGSDAHKPEIFGNAVTEVAEDLAIRESLEKGLTKVQGEESPKIHRITRVLYRIRKPQYLFRNPFS